MTVIRSDMTSGGFSPGSGLENRTMIFYCVLYIDRYSNRVLESVYIDRSNAETYRNRSSQRLYIEPERVRGYSGQDTLWCSNEWGPADVLSFINLHTDYDEAHKSCYASGRPSPVKISDISVFPKG